MAMNYLIMEDFSGQEVPFIFPLRVDHADMREQLPYAQAISCGQVSFGLSGPECAGGNPGLNLTARKEDEQIIEKALA